MAKQTINIGASPNDGTGTPLRTSFDYCNQNFTELYTSLGGGTGLPGLNGEVIFNNGTSLAGDPAFVFDAATDMLSVTGFKTFLTTQLSTIGTLYVGTLATPKLKVDVAGTGITTITQADITGDLTVDTSTLKVDSANDIVLIGSATKATYGANKLEVRSASISDANLGATTTGNLAIFTTDSQAIDTGGVLSLGGGFNGTAPYMFAGIAGRKETATNAIAQGYLQLFTTNVSNGIIERYRIAGDGVHTWRNVGGVAGTAMTLNSTGLNVANGNVILGTSGKGIDFSATASGSGTMTSELLNDYEEGTWTIGLTFGGGNTGLTTALNTGRYTKVGRQVTVCGRLELSNKGSSTGAADITGLPFAVGSGNDSQQAASFRFNGVSYTGAFQGFGLVGATTIHLEQISEAGSPSDLTNSNFSNSTSIQISFTYTI